MTHWGEKLREAIRLTSVVYKNIYVFPCNLEAKSLDSPSQHSSQCNAIGRLWKKYSELGKILKSGEN